MGFKSIIILTLKCHLLVKHYSPLIARTPPSYISLLLRSLWKGQGRRPDDQERVTKVQGEAGDGESRGCYKNRAKLPTEKEGKGVKGGEHDTLRKRKLIKMNTV